MPGVDCLTDKVEISTTADLKYLPKSFKLPVDKDKFLKYASQNRNAMFLQKGIHHRGVELRTVADMDLNTDTFFVQEFIPNPLLVDGYKFDIGVYVVVTSVDPLRVYYYTGEVLFRFCLEKYLPFDPKIKDKYVIESDLRNIWDVPALATIFKDGFNMKDTFDIYMRSKGEDTTKMWEDVHKAIRELFLKKEKQIISALQKYPSSENFFHLHRIDLIVDEDLKVYLMECEMHPVLYSPKKPWTKIMYQQLLYSLFSIIGMANPIHPFRLDASKTDCDFEITDEDYDNCMYFKQHCGNETKEELEDCMEEKSEASMLSAQKNIAVWGDECSFSCKDHCRGVCGLCRPCLTPKNRKLLLNTYREHMQRMEFRRIIPPPIKPHAPIENLDHLSQKNQLVYLWYQGKCNLDSEWCT